MRSRKTVLYAAALAGVVSLGLAGCNGGDEDPTSSPTSTSSSSSTASPSGSDSPSASATGSATLSPSVSVSVPAAARAQTEAGAIAFATFAMDQADAGYVSVDPAPFRALSGPSCEGCQGIVDGIEKLKASGYHQKGRALKIDDAIGTAKGDGATVDLLITQVAVPFVHTSGKEAGGPKAEKYRMRVTSKWAADSWQITEMGKS